MWYVLIFVFCFTSVGVALHVVRHRVVRFRHADLRVRPVARLARELRAADARDVGLIGEHQQVEQQLHVIVVRLRHAARLSICGSRVGVLLLGQLNPPLDVAHRVQIVADDRLVAATDAPLQAVPVRSTESRMLRLVCICLEPLGRLPPSPNSRSKTMRGLLLVRQRLRRRAPRRRVVEMPPAIGEESSPRQLERAQRRVGAELVRRILIDRLRQPCRACPGIDPVNHDAWQRVCGAPPLAAFASMLLRPLTTTS